MTSSSEPKDRVRDFWNLASCGEDLYLRAEDKPAFEKQREIRYALEPICEFAKFGLFSGKKTLEIGVGLGADHQSLAEAGAVLSGIDLTERAVDFTRKRFALLELSSDLCVGDAENLPFENESFDAVYSWGVIHHSPDTVKAAGEIYRVLRSGGIAKVMIYHRYSMVGYMLWLRYGLGAFKPWKTLREIYSMHLESPGTKAYSYSEARELFKRFNIVDISTPLGHSDLLESMAGQRHRGKVLTAARALWPRRLIRKFLPNSGLTMMIVLKKP